MGACSNQNVGVWRINITQNRRAPKGYRLTVAASWKPTFSAQGVFRQTGCTNAARRGGGGALFPHMLHRSHNGDSEVSSRPTPWRQLSASLTGENTGSSEN